MDEKVPCVSEGRDTELNARGPPLEILLNLIDEISKFELRGCKFS